MNKWLENHLKKQEDYSFQYRDNDIQCGLVWESEDFCAEMPILRANYMEMQADYQAYFTDCEVQARKERFGKWVAHTSLSTIWESLRTF